MLESKRFSLPILLRKQESNLRPLGYEPSEIPLLHSAVMVYFFAPAVIPNGIGCANTWFASTDTALTNSPWELYIQHKRILVNMYTLNRVQK